jgi:hypothetical protein
VAFNPQDNYATALKYAQFLDEVGQTAASDYRYENLWYLTTLGMSENNDAVINELNQFLYEWVNPLTYENATDYIATNAIGFQEARGVALANFMNTQGSMVGATNRIIARQNSTDWSGTESRLLPLSIFGDTYNSLSGTEQEKYGREFIVAAKELGYDKAIYQLTGEAGYISNQAFGDYAEVDEYVSQVQSSLRSAANQVEDYMYQKQSYVELQQQYKREYNQAQADIAAANQQTALYQQQAAETARQTELIYQEQARINDETNRINQQIEQTQQEIVQYEAEYNKYVKELDELERLNSMPTTTWRAGYTNQERRGSSFGGTSITGAGGVAGVVPTRSKGLLGA